MLSALVAGWGMSSAPPSLYVVFNVCWRCLEIVASPVALGIVTEYYDPVSTFPVDHRQINPELTVLALVYTKAFLMKLSTVYCLSCGSTRVPERLFFLSDQEEKESLSFHKGQQCQWTKPHQTGSHHEFSLALFFLPQSHLRSNREPWCSWYKHLSVFITFLKVLTTRSNLVEDRVFVSRMRVQSMRVCWGQVQLLVVVGKWSNRCVSWEFRKQDRKWASL